LAGTSLLRALHNHGVLVLVQVLHFWLSHSPDYEEVTRWYLGWKAAFPPALIDQERVRRQFNAALDLMNSAVDGRAPLPATAAAQPLVGAGVAGGTGYAGRWAADMDGLGQQAPLPAVPPGGMGSVACGVTAAAATELTLKDLVERFAAENGISFMPKPNRFQDGLQVGGGGC
jgi:tuftelin-interacting protein 11